jgi:hypothetical protein
VARRGGHRRHVQGIFPVCGPIKCHHAKLTLLALSRQTFTASTRWPPVVSSCRRFQAKLLCYVGYLVLFSFTAVDAPTPEIRRNDQRLPNYESIHIWYFHRDGYSTVSNRIYFSNIPIRTSMFVLDVTMLPFVTVHFLSCLLSCSGPPALDIRYANR